MCGLVLVVLGVVAAAHAESRPGYGGAIVASLPSEPASIDPLMARSLAEVTVAGLVYDTLYRPLPDGSLLPQLAAGPAERRGDAVRVPIRSGVVWHDGRAVTVDDVVASLRRLRVAGGLHPAVTSVRADGAAVILEAPATAADVAAALARPQAAITPGGRPPTALPIGSGPFAVVSLDRSARRLTLRAHAGHFAGRPYLDEIALDWFVDAAAEARRYEVGDAQISARGASAFVGHAPSYVSTELEGPATRLSYVGFGASAAAVDPALRRALHLVLPRGALATGGLGERVVPATTPVPADLDPARGASATVLAGQLDLARRALAAATAPSLRADARATTVLTLAVDATRLDDVELAERVVRALARLSLSARVEALAPGAFAAAVAAGTPDLHIGELALTSALPGLALWDAFRVGGDVWARDQLARGPLDPAAATAAFEARLPIVPLVHRAQRFYLRADLRGAAVDLVGRLSFADLFLHGSPTRARRR